MRTNEFSFTDDDLRQAAHVLSQRMMASLPRPEECTDSPSPMLKAKIDLIIARNRRRTVIQRISKRVASILLCILIGCTTWLAVDAEARSAFFQWVREVYEDSILYRYFNDPVEESIPGPLPTFTISPLPDGYSELTTMGDDYIRMTMFSGPDGTVMLSYQRANATTQTELFGDDFVCTETTVGKVAATFYNYADPATSNELIWIDDAQNISFRLSAQLDELQMLTLAESVKIAK